MCSKVLTKNHEFLHVFTLSICIMVCPLEGWLQQMLKVQQITRPPQPPLRNVGFDEQLRMMKQIIRKMVMMMMIVRMRMVWWWVPRNVGLLGLLGAVGESLLIICAPSRCRCTLAKCNALQYYNAWCIAALLSCSAFCILSLVSTTTILYHLYWQ